MAETIHGTFLETANTYPDRSALMYKRGGRYLKITYGELKDSVSAVAASLQKLGINKGDTIRIFSHNRPEWAMADLAVLHLGGVVVPIYPTLPPSGVRYILKDSRIKMIFVENSDRFAVIDRLRSDTHDLENIVVFDDPGIGRQVGFLRFEDVQKTVFPVSDTGPCVSGDDTATIVYTSGTTGEPKGVILRHGNIVSNAGSVMNRYHVTFKDVMVSYLPLSHMFERTCGYYAVLFAGASIAYAEGLSRLLQNVAEIRPTLLLAVPRVIEKAYDEVAMNVEKSSRFKSMLVSRAIRNLNSNANLSWEKKRIPWRLRIKFHFYNTLIASRIRQIVGGRLRVIASGGAPLDQKIAKRFRVFGLNVVEGYGLTETSPIVCCHSPGDSRLGTVGQPLPGVKVKIAENDEILVKGTNVMKGYLNRPTETAMVIDNDGWFHTGDQGRFDEHGNLIITGRMKERIITSYGKNVSPAPIEAKMTKSRYITQAVLYGDKRKYCAAIIVPDRGNILRHATEKMIPFNSYQSLLERQEIRALIGRDIEQVNQNLPSYEQVKVFALVSEVFSVENGLVTPTLKIKREKVAEKYRGLIESMYEGKNMYELHYSWF